THLDLASSPHHLLLVSEGESSGFWLGARMSDESATWDSWLTGLHAILPFSNLTSLDINIHCEHTFWPEALRHMSQLTRLDVLVGMSKTVWHQRPSSSDMLCDLLVLPGTPVLAPALRELRLEVLEFVPHHPVPTSSLRQMLEHRARAGCLLHRLAVQLSGESLDAVLVQKTGRELAAALSGHVQVFDLVDASERPGLCQFTTRDDWDVAGAEVYWTLWSSDQPWYNFWPLSREW
ncbi:hypothetical protein C8T65DRAFT_572405, partial [Cerioporus squamosus]